jgi:hypothetical protein
MKKIFSAFSWQQYVMIVVTHLITGSVVWVGLDYFYSYQV